MRNLCSLQYLVGKKVLAIRGERTYYSKRRKYGFAPKYILFSDKKSLIRLEEQDADYHDCAASAMHIHLSNNKIEWERIFMDKYNYPIADLNI